MEDRPDHALVADVARGDAAALRTLYLRYERPTFNLILRLAGDREMAQDMMQETFTRVWTMARTFRGDRGTFKGWLFTIALNLTRSELARKRRGSRHLAEDAVEELASQADGPDTLLQRSEVGRRVAAALAHMAPHLREVVVMKVYHQLKFREIADITKTPEGTLKARFHRAVAELRERLAPPRSGQP
ncbi:MAG: RNA polymerase subunit sigma-24 [Acidobacteria bacterium]|nr:MAG: RNA polymerase subunit sigma-24 [Acidobacteriota bacterium]